MASFVDLFDQPSFDARWTIANATLDTVNDRADLSTGTLGTGAGGMLQSEWDDLDFTFVPEIVNLYTAGAISLYITKGGLVNGRGCRLLFDKQSASGGGDRILIGFIENNFDSVVVAQTVSTSDFSPNPTIRVQRSSAGLWTVSVNGVAKIIDQAEPAAITADTDMQAGILFDTGAANIGFIHSVELVGDIVAPTLSSPTGTATGATTATGTVSTNEANGNLFFIASQNATETAEFIETNGSSQAVSATGVQNVNVTGLLGLQSYYLHYAHEDESGNLSTSVSSAQFTTEAYTRTIVDIDSDNNVRAGQTGVVITTTGLDAVPTNQTITLGGEDLNVVSWTDDVGIQTIIVDVPLHINLGWGSANNTLSVTDDTGTVALNDVTLSTPTGWETVTLTTLPDTAETESFYEYSQADADVGNFVAEVGDILAFESQSGLTVNGSTIPLVEPPANVSGAYKWWDATLSTWTQVSGFTVTDDGLPQFPQSLVTIDSITENRTSAVIVFSYPGADATSFQYNIGNGWLSAVSPLTISDLVEQTSYTLQMRPVNNGAPGTVTSTSFTTLAAVDTTPNAFSLTAQTGVARSVFVTSNTITVQDVDAGVDVPISVSGTSGEYSVSTDGGQTWGTWTSAATNVRLNYQVRVRHLSSSSYNMPVSTVLTIGGVSSTFTSTTLADMVAPVITLLGNASVTITEGQTYTDAGATATDNVDGDLTGSIVTVNPVNTAVPGSYTVTYNVSDAAGNAATEVARSVTVEAAQQQVTAPTENVSNPMPASFYIRAGTPYLLSQHVTNPDNATLVYAVAQGSPALPAGVTLNASTGALTAANNNYTPVSGLSFEVTVA